MNRLKKCFPVLSAITLTLSACGGGGSGPESGFSCAYIPGDVSASSASVGCSGCSTSNARAVADSNQESFSAIKVQIGQYTTTITDTYSGPSFPVGSKVGALMTFLGGATPDAITFNTYLNGVARDSVVGATLNTESTNGTTPAQTYISFPATLEFDSLQIVVEATNGNEFRIYEFCGDS